VSDINFPIIHQTGKTPLDEKMLEKLVAYKVDGTPKTFDYTDENGTKQKFQYHSLVPQEEKGRPVIYATGFLSNGAMIPGIMGSFPEVAGRKLVFAHEITGVPYHEYLISHGIPEETIRQFESEHLKKAVALLQILDAENITEADVFAHSEWVIHALIAAQLFPHRFKNTVLNSSVGLAEEQTVLSLVIKTIGEQVRGKVENILNKTPISYDPKQNRTFSSWDGWNGKVRSTLWESLKLMPKTDIQPLIEKVRASGIKIFLTHADKDKAFPFNELKAKFWWTPEKYVDGFEVVSNADHNTIIRQPWPFVEHVINKFFI
jgi:pimeloyl-ACP methyl ester carboxylesterase